MKYLLVEKLKVFPIIYHEVAITSNVDKVYEFGNHSYFFNVVVPADFVDGDSVVVSIVRKQSITLMFVWDFDDEFAFNIETKVINKFQFELDQEWAKARRLTAIPSRDSMTGKFRYTEN